MVACTLLDWIFHLANGRGWKSMVVVTQGYEDPYVPGTDENLLKWKFADMNSVDFRLRSKAAGKSLTPCLKCKKRPLHSYVCANSSPTPGLCISLIFVPPCVVQIQSHPSDLRFLCNACGHNGSMIFDGQYMVCAGPELLLLHPHGVSHPVELPLPGQRC